MPVDDRSIRVFALGGLGEIGMNCLAIEVSNRILLIDCGAMFSSEGLGIDLIHPGFDILTERRDDIEALVLTHAHEDHIAAVPYLLREMDVPIYGASYTLGLLQKKMEEFDLSPKLVARQLNPGDQRDIGSFSVTSFPMPHSIVQNAGLLIDTPAGRILHTGDFKLGKGEPKKNVQVLSRLRELSAGGIDLMLSDSTGSEEVEMSGDEADVAITIDQLVKNSSGRVFVAVFSSNIHRLQSILEIAQNNGRKVAFCGRSVQTHSRIASEVGALKIPFGLTTSLEEAADTSRSRSLVVVSGTQGEPRSALSKLASDTHHVLRIEKGDTVVFSSRFIPGNELAIGRVIDNLQRIGATVVHRGSNSGVHVSGHGSKSEIQAAIEAVSPRCFVPVHGTYRHLVACAELAKKTGVENICVASDGQVAICDQGGLRLSESHLKVSRVFIDGGGGLSEGEIRDRRVLGSHGVLSVSIVIKDNGDIKSPMEVLARGVVREEAMPWLSKQVEEKVTQIVSNLDPSVLDDPVKRRDTVRSALRRYLSKQISREPYVLISIISSNL